MPLRRPFTRYPTYGTLLLCLVLLASSCGDNGASVGPSPRLRVCMAPDTMPVTISGDTTFMVFERCW